MSRSPHLGHTVHLLACITVQRFASRTAWPSRNLKSHDSMWSLVELIQT